MPEHARIIPEHVCMPEYAGIFQNMLKSAWMAFVLFLHCNPLSTWTHGYLFHCLFETWSYSLKIFEAVFLKRQNLIISIIAGRIWYAFCFRQNIFTRCQR